MTAGFVFVVFVSRVGSCSGSSREEGSAADDAARRRLEDRQTIKITAAPGGGLTFAPVGAEREDRLYLVDVRRRRRRAAHASASHDPTTLFAALDVEHRRRDAAGADRSSASRATYTFFCAIPGHEAAGMKGIVTVTGPPMTLQRPRRSATSGKPAARRRLTLAYGTRDGQRVAHGFHRRRAAGRRVRRRRRRPSAPTRRATRARRVRRGTCCTFGCADVRALEDLREVHEELRPRHRADDGDVEQAVVEAARRA